MFYFKKKALLIYFLKFLAQKGIKKKSIVAKLLAYKNNPVYFILFDAAFNIFKLGIQVSHSEALGFKKLTDSNI
jgi:hypothetical protein